MRHGGRSFGVGALVLLALAVLTCWMFGWLIALVIALVFARPLLRGLSPRHGSDSE